MSTCVARWSRIAKLIAANWCTRIGFALGRKEGFSGLTHTHLPTAESLQYIDRVVADYLHYGGLHEDSLRNARILELGPGDNFGVALRFLSLGARQVFCLDKFEYQSDSSSGDNRKIYRALRESLPDSQRASFDAAVNLEGAVKFNPEKLRCIYGSGAETCDVALAGERFDMIFSRAVIHEVFDIDRAFAAMDRLLGPGGRMIHKVDLRDYGMFTALDMHPREFLTVPDTIYTQMVKGSARPNRRMMNYYRDKFGALGYEAKLYISCIVQRHNPPGVHQPEIVPHKEKLEYGVDYTDADLALNAEIRPRLAAPFRTLTDEELLAGGLMLAAVKRPA